MSSKRERYNNANIRGGMGVRKRLSEDSMRPTYRLNGVQTGSAVARCLDKYGRWEGGYVLGVIARRTSSIVQIRWLGDEDITTYSQGDARYEVERGRWKILGILQANPMNPENPLADALRELARSDSIVTNDHPTPTTEETDMEQSNAAAEREAAQKALANGDFKDRETYTAKQVAGRCGTDSKTMRKFFRSPHSTVEPVGQGGRYEFAASDFPKIKKEFDAWQKRSSRRPIHSPGAKALSEKFREAKSKPKKSEQGDPAPKADPNPEPEPGTDNEWDADKWGTPPQKEEPTPEELAELEDLELDLDDLDAEDD